MKVKVFDFFSGCGGASYGFREAGMSIVFALDWDSDSQRTFEVNFPSVHFELADIRTTKVSYIRSLVNMERPNPILFCGCAPCQPFTKQNTKHPARKNDERVPLLSCFAKFVVGCKPDIVFVENVPGLQKLNRRTQPFGKFLQSLEEAGYHVAYRRVPLMKYGVPQSRCRLVLLASRHGTIGLPTETNGPGTTNPEYETVRNWIEDLPPIAAGKEFATVPNHCAARLSELNLERLRATPEGGGHRDWPKRLQLECHKKISGYSDVYGRMSWDRPAPGLTTRCISYSNGRFGHPEQNRAISVREAACLQTFPRDFFFEGTLASMARQIGNAVPVRMATIIGHHVNRHLKNAGVLT
ncbi:MAG: DNA cytosine methyltransferase [Nitrospira sp.]|nr:DNA cytosine methyltransferase [Nitrospira sp.]